LTKEIFSKNTVATDTNGVVTIAMYNNIFIEKLNRSALCKETLKGARGKQN
jgi:hypothetical protein